MQEIFKPIKNYEEKYEISTHGRVKSLICRTSSEPQLLKLQTNNKGYVYVELSQPSKKYFIHRLVAETFLDNPTNLPLVNHLDNNPSNNLVTNLEWCTQSQNLKHAQNQGRLLEAQRAGGITTTTNNKLMATSLAKSLINTTYHAWKVTSYVGTKCIGPSLEREYVLCTCACGTTAEIYYASILSGVASKSCTKCASLKLSANHKNALISSICDTIVGTWKVIKPINNSETTTSRKLKFLGICNVCGFETVLTQPSLIGTKPLKSCPSLKCKGKDIV